VAAVSAPGQGQKSAPGQGLRASVRVAVGGPYDFADATHRVDQDRCLRCKCPSRVSPPGGQIIVDGKGRVGAGCGRKRAAKKVDAPAGVLRRIAEVSAELRGAEVPRSAPPGRERPVVILGVEGPDVEFLDAVLPVHIVQGSALAQGPAHQTAGIAARTARIALEELGLGIGGQRDEAQKVSYLDMGQRPIHVLGHAAILAPKLPDRCDAETSDMRHRAADDGENAPAPRGWVQAGLRIGC